MNKWSLSIKSSELDQEYKLQENETNYRILKILSFTVLLSSSLQLIVNFYTNKDFQLKVFLYFLIYFIAGSVCIIVASIKIKLFNEAVMFSLVTYISIIAWSNKDSDLKTFFTQDTTITPFVRGFFLSITLCSLILGTNFIMKFIFIIFVHIAIMFSTSQNPALDTIKMLPTIIAFIYKITFNLHQVEVYFQQIYQEDKQKRTIFLLKKKDQIWDYLVDYLLPNSLILCKFNEEINRFELFSQNKKAREEFKVENTEDFYSFSKHLILNSYSEHKQMKEKLEQYKAPTWESTLYGQISSKFQKEIKKRSQEIQKKAPKTETNLNVLQQKIKTQLEILKEEKQLLSAQKGSKINIKDNSSPKRVSIFDSLRRHKNWSWDFLKKNSNATREIPVSDRSVSKSQKNNEPNQLLGDCIQNSIPCNQEDQNDMKDVDQFQGHLINEQYIPIPNKKFSVKIITFYLNDYFAVISLQRDEYREKYLQTVEEIRKNNQILDNSFISLNSLSVSSFKLTKDLLISQTLPIKKSQISESSTTRYLNKLFYYGYSLKQTICNILEWMNRQKKGLKQNQNLINIRDTISGLTKVFEEEAKEKQIMFKIEIEDQIKEDPIKSNERKLNQILFNLLKYCVTQSKSQKDIQIAISKNSSNDQLIQFKLIFIPEDNLNFSYLNCAEINDENEINYLVLFDLKISKYILRSINPKGRIVFAQNQNNMCEISFNIISSSSLSSPCQSNILPSYQILPLTQINSENNNEPFLFENYNDISYSEIKNKKEKISGNFFGGGSLEFNNQNLNEQISLKKSNMLNAQTYDIIEQGTASGNIENCKKFQKISSFKLANEKNYQDQFNGENVINYQFNTPKYLNVGLTETLYTGNNALPAKQTQGDQYQSDLHFISGFQATQSTFLNDGRNNTVMLARKQDQSMQQSSNPPEKLICQKNENNESRGDSFEEEIEQNSKRDIFHYQSIIKSMKDVVDPFRQSPSSLQKAQQIKDPFNDTDNQFLSDNGEIKLFSMIKSRKNCLTDENNDGEDENSVMKIENNGQRKDLFL